MLAVVNPYVVHKMDACGVLDMRCVGALAEQGAIHEHAIEALAVAAL